MNAQELGQAIMRASALHKRLQAIESAKDTAPDLRRLARDERQGLHVALEHGHAALLTMRARAARRPTPNPNNAPQSVPDAMRDRAEHKTIADGTAGIANAIRDSEALLRGWQL